MNSTTSLAGISVILQTNQEVDQAAKLLAAIGLEVNGEDGYVEVAGAGITLSIMRGAMVSVPPHGGLLLQIRVADVDASAAAAERAGATVALSPMKADGGGCSAFLQSPGGFTIELRSTDQ